MKLGVQVFGSLNIFRENPEKYMEDIRSYGYTQLEPCIGLGMTKSDLESSPIKPWIPEEVSGFKALMDKKGLELLSAHIFGDALAHIEELKNMAVKNGITSIVMNFPQDGLLEALPGFIDMCKKVGAELSSVGVELWLHNNAGEIRTKVDGKTALEHVLEECGGKVKTQIDTGWVQYGGEDPVEYLKKVKPYLKSVHYKDLKKDYKNLDPRSVHACLGEGCLDNRKIANYLKDLDITQLIDQDASDGSFMEDLRKSAEFIAQL